jgi:hypothetical protein
MPLLAFDLTSEEWWAVVMAQNRGDLHPPVLAEGTEAAQVVR